MERGQTVTIREAFDEYQNIQLAYILVGICPECGYHYKTLCQGNSFMGDRKEFERFLKLGVDIDGYEEEVKFTGDYIWDYSSDDWDEHYDIGYFELEYDEPPYSHYNCNLCSYFKEENEDFWQRYSEYKND